jgi:hypothetical protein
MLDNTEGAIKNKVRQYRRDKQKWTIQRNRTSRRRQAKTTAKTIKTNKLTNTQHNICSTSLYVNKHK